MIIIIAIVSLPIVLSYGINSIKKNDQKTITHNEDDNRKSYAKYIISEYDDFYNDWVIKRGYKLPLDASGCTKWNGCQLSFPYGDAELPNGYTYSINTLENGVVFSQNGADPHATSKNIALYKRARCGENGTVIGGQIDKNAAAVVRLSNGSYYCTQN